MMMKATMIFAVALTGALAAGSASAAEDCDLKLGERTFKKCRACHKLVDGKRGIGPDLFGIVGRDVASVEGFRYSKSMAKYGEPADLIWTAETLDAFLTKPKKFIKGTRMSFRGIKSEAQRAALICYLGTIK